MSTKKIFNLISIGTVWMYICIFLSYNVIFPKLSTNGLSGNIFLGLIIAWMPIFIFIGIAVVYLLAFVSEKYLKVLPFIYGYIGTLLMALASLIFLKWMIINIHILLMNIGLVSLFVISLTLQLWTSNKLLKKSFDVHNEMGMVEKIRNRDSEIKGIHQLQKKINRIHYVFFILCVADALFYVFLAAVVLAAIITFKPLLQLKVEYQNSDFVPKKQGVWVLINYYMSIALAVPIYLYSPMLALLIIFFGRVAQYILDNRFARKKYADLELLIKSNEYSKDGDEWMEY